MIKKPLNLLAKVPLFVAGVLTGTLSVSAATIGSSIDFSGYVFGSSNQFDYIDSANFPLVPNPNVDGSFQVINATGSFAPALTVPSSFGIIRDTHEGISSGLITRSGPLFNGTNNPNLFVPNFLRLTVSSSVDFSFQLETVLRVVEIDPNSDPLDPSILKISSTLTGTLTDSVTNEVQAAVGTFLPNIPLGIKLSQLSPDNFLGPVLYDGSLQVVSEPISVPEPSTSASLALFGLLMLGYGLKKKEKSIDH